MMRHIHCILMQLFSSRRRGSQSSCLLYRTPIGRFMLLQYLLHLGFGNPFSRKHVEISTLHIKPSPEELQC
ncbi:TPA: hypothetical protein N0F65_008128 [Lagenidium giganteum]|uniref:Uncharacterized protein n=1 Tax=Lagenidium giganteum TaxID=4803 RepID=A0AAV2Z1B5_9STRA|nr:TPA: hypothetical protein N0F65_008128 [Lagenidium giganteum]